MVSAENIHELKHCSTKLLHFIKSASNKNITYTLKRLGKLPNSFNEAPLLYLLNSDNTSIRFLAIKNLAKLSKLSLLHNYENILKTENSTEVRRETVSAIGRLRNKKVVLILRNLLTDHDPEVVLQAIRGLLVFKNEEAIKAELLKLKAHPNEIIADVIKKEFKEKVPKKSTQKHSEFPDFLKNKVVHGDVQDILKHVPDASIHLTFTSPPYYNARDYSTYQSYEAYLNFLENVFKEIYRTTKEGRFFVLNTSLIIIPRVSRQHASKRYPIPYDLHGILMKMGWEFVDDII